MSLLGAGLCFIFFVFFFFFNDTATTEIYTRPYTLSLHDALPISVVFDPHEQPGGPKEPAPHLQVPAVMLAAAEHAAALRLEGGCDGIEPLVRSLPVLAPHGGRHGPERCWL